MNRRHDEPSTGTVVKSDGRFSIYGRLFRLPGAKAFCVSGAIARLPNSMISLGIVLALNHLYDNWTIAGTMSAAYIFAVAAVTPFYARLFDRFGQGKVGWPCLALSVTMMLVFAFAALFRVPIAVLFILAVLTGLTQFAFGALVRTRWAYALRGEKSPDLLNAAYSMEAGIDEMVFILGPILAAFLATSVHPVSQLFVPAVACAIGGIVFFSLKDTQPPIVENVRVEASSQLDEAALHGSGNVGGLGDAQPMSLKSLRTGRAKPKSALLYGGVVPLVVVFVVFNMSFNEFDVSVTAMMKAIGREQYLGLQLAMFAVGSCIGAFAFGSVKLKGSKWRHLVVFLSLLTFGYVCCRLSMDSLPLLALFSVLSGLTVSPCFATGNLIIKDIVPPSSLTEGLSWINTAGSVGASLGSSLAGLVLDASDPHVALLLPVLTTFLAVPLSLCGWLLSRRRP
ncbi:MFS transporter [Bifidobacterium bombi]|uniref:MFS major facilitator superfamily protein n=1 Tax=Bifidobacterium bombi DSM 19703 TaxID=1341695 RepID=A0A080N2U5_9BIFI|nr:MFS transporter [Bifidobacterium bombi]KFF31347.1 MFS major facilitator superfamily protein [Bifidobacterium bombi DSM 19703]